jgi:HEAT repeat protein
MKKVIVVFFIFLLSSNFVFAQDESLVDKWRDDLLYGIDSKIIGVLNDMQNAENEELAGDVQSLLNSPNEAVQIAAIKYFIHFENDTVVNKLREDLLFYQDLTNKYIIELLQALQSFEIEVNTEEQEILFEMAEEPNQEVQLAAISAMSAIADAPSTSAYLLEYYDKPGINNNIRNAILLALGELKDSSAQEILIDIVDDEGEDSTLRISAISALAKIGSDEAFRILRRNLSDESPLIRAAIIGSMGEFSPSQVEDVYQQALRDSFWRVRISALRTIAELNLTSLAPAIRYMSENDPEANIKHQAYRTLGDLGGNESWEHMRENVQDEKIGEDLKLTMLVELIENDFAGSKSVLEELMLEEWEEQNSRILDTICKTMALNEIGETSASLFERMLGHPNFIIQIYAARGIAKNNLLRFRTTLESLIEDTSNETLKLNIQAAIDSF